MGKIRLKFNNISEIVGTMGIGVIVLTDEAFKSPSHAMKT